MKKLLLTVILGSTLGLKAFAQSYDDTKSCVTVYAKHYADQPNLSIVCDGTLVLSHIMRTEDKLENPTEFYRALYAGFQEIVNPSKRKVCNAYDSENIWWASCISE